VRISVIDHLDTLHEFTTSQLGLVTSRQARSVGWTRQQIHRAGRGHRLELVHPGVWRLPGVPTTWEHTLLAAVLAAGPDAAASHRSALAVFRIPPAHRHRPRWVHVSVAADRHPVVNGAVIHRVHLPATHITMIDGIPTTTFERTLVDNAATLGLGQLARALDQGLVDGQVSLASLRAVIAELLPAPGRRRAHLLKLVKERSPASELTDSEAEIRVLTAIRGAGLPEPVPQFPVNVDGENFFLDAAYAAQRLGIEYHGWDTHRTRSAFDADFRRDRMLTIAGWTVVYFTRTSSDRDIVETVQRLGVTSRRS
jgi:very-short-patch-repair endonuclease